MCEHQSFDCILMQRGYAGEATNYPEVDWADASE